MQFSVLGAVYIGQGTDVATSLTESRRLPDVELNVALRGGRWVLWHVNEQQIPAYEANDYRQGVGVNLPDGTRGIEMVKHLMQNETIKDVVADDT